MILSYAKASNVFGLSDMQSKDLATIRVSNLSPSLGESRLHHFFDRRNVNATSHISLCPHTSGGESLLVATVTFESQSSAKKALNLNGRLLAGRNVSIDRGFMGLTVLAIPRHPSLEQGLTAIGLSLCSVSLNTMLSRIE